jgi:hypothetical protein
MTGKAVALLISVVLVIGVRGARRRDFKGAMTWTADRRDLRPEPLITLGGAISR